MEEAYGKYWLDIDTGERTLVQLMLARNNTSGYNRGYREKVWVGMGNLWEAKVQQLQRWSGSRKLLVNGYEPYGRSED